MEIHTDGRGKVTLYRSQATIPKNNPDIYNLLDDSDRARFLSDTQFLYQIDTVLRAIPTLNLQMLPKGIREEIQEKAKQLAEANSASVYLVLLIRLATEERKILLNQPISSQMRSLKHRIYSDRE